MATGRCRPAQVEAIVAHLDDTTVALFADVEVCSRHHHRLHRPGWHAKLRPDDDFEVTDPEGRVRTTSPPRTEPPW